MPTTSPNRPARPTVAQAYAIVQQLSAAQYQRLMLKLNQTLEDNAAAAAQRVHKRMEAAGVIITDAEIDAEVEAVRASRYAASFH